MFLGFLFRQYWCSLFVPNKRRSRSDIFSFFRMEGEKEVNMWFFVNILFCCVFRILVQLVFQPPQPIRWWVRNRSDIFFPKPGERLSIKNTKEANEWPKRDEKSEKSSCQLVRSEKQTKIIILSFFFGNTLRML